MTKEEKIKAMEESIRNIVNEKFKDFEESDGDAFEVSLDHLRTKHQKKSAFAEILDAAIYNINMSNPYSFELHLYISDMYLNNSRSKFKLYSVSSVIPSHVRDWFYMSKLIKSLNFDDHIIRVTFIPLSTHGMMPIEDFDKFSDLLKRILKRKTKHDFEIIDETVEDRILIRLSDNEVKRRRGNREWRVMR